LLYNNITSLQNAFINPLEPHGLFMMDYDGWMCFLERQKLGHYSMPLQIWEEPGYNLI